jgi:lipid A 3-O-deacylase
LAYTPGEASWPMLHNSGIIVPVIVVLFLARAAEGSAQDSSSPRVSAQLEVDNDLLALRGRGPPPDYDYTHGTRITITRPNAPEWLGRALGTASRCSDAAIERGCLLSGLAVGQEIYTPRHNTRDPVAGDRPHAAWLYGGIQLQRPAGTTLQALELRAGITGPPALGEQVQNGVHRLLHNHLEAGWEHQLPTRVGVTADYDATALLGNSLRAPSRFVAANVGATLGNLRREIRVGGSAYYGFGPMRVPIANAPLIARPGRFYLLASYQQSLVLYDAFVEGYDDTQGAVRLPFVGEASAGAGWRFNHFAVEYRYISRGREYRAEPGRHAYGALALSVVGH